MSASVGRNAQELRDFAGSSARVRNRVSVIVPTRNSVRTIEYCLQSVRSQSYPDVEIVLVDNRSTDGTCQVATSLADRVITAGPERSTQRNIGAAASTGEFIIFLDSDMVASAALAGEVVGELSRHPGLDALVIPERSIGKGFWAKCRILEKQLYVGDPDMEAARAFRFSAFDRVGGYDEALQAGGEDWDLPDRLAEAGRLIGRVRSEVVHDEGRLSLRADLRKKFYYGRSLGRYVWKHPKRSIFKVLRRSWYRNFHLLWRDPLHSAGMLVLKLMEAGAAMAGMLAGMRRAHPHD